jgi:hypothetical protein
MSDAKTGQRIVRSAPMRKSLAATQIHQYEELGYVAPIRVMSEAAAAELRGPVGVRKLSAIGVFTLTLGDTGEIANARAH